MNIKTIAINVGILAVTAYTVNTFANTKAHWGYSGSQGPSNWSSLDKKYHMCSEGKNQSPINISNTIDSKLEKIVFNNSANGTQFVNNGHTVQANFAKGSSIEIDSDTYNLLQFHFHTPSENIIDGKSYPLEMHMVHANSAGNLAVVGVMFEEGKKRNEKMKKVLRALPLDAEDENDFETGVMAYDFLPSSKEYFRFNGSLTTPPCSEGVKWFVIKKPVSISDGQLKQIQDVMGKNNRPLQPKNSRAILR